ncbi:hypothetical protein HD806DRAFT_548883 [Xylariaceae sp. AK1471]|nr:hypothetical protein HD806DRAFT_548883 [Xylariaceae sp. AK1471]
MLKGRATSQQSVLLDYVSQFQPFAIYAAVKNKDYHVAASTLVSRLLRLVIVISTSFIVLLPINIPREDAEVILKSRFVNDPSGLSATGGLAFSSLYAWRWKNVSLPEGISAKYAYVPAATNIQNISELVTNVDGFEGGLHCEPATVTSLWGTLLLSNGLTEDARPFPTLRLKSDSCEMTIQPDCSRSVLGDESGCTGVFILSETCNGLNSTYKRAIGIVAFSVINTPDSAINATRDPEVFLTDITILRANSFICTPFYNIRPIRTLRTDAGLQVSLVPDTTSRQLSSVSPWDVWDAYFDVVQSPEVNVNIVSSSWLYEKQLHLDGCSWLAFEFAKYTGSEVLSSPSWPFVGDNIARLISSCYQQYSAILARVSLMKDTSTPSLGSAIVSKQRLLVQSLPTHIITGLLLLSVAMVVITWRARSKLLLLQSPNTIIGNVILLAHSPLSLTGLGSVSAVDLETVMDRWVYGITEAHNAATNTHQLSLIINQKVPIVDSQDDKEMKTSTYRPRSLSVPFRLFAFLLSIGMIVTLEILLERSEHNDGIADAPAKWANQQLWTVFPGLFSTLISMYAASVDADTRSQSPLLRLRRGVAFEALSLNLVDRHAFTLMFEETISQCFESLASTLAVTITSLLTIFSASLFFTTTSSAQTHVRLKTSSLIYYDSDAGIGQPIAMQPVSVGAMILLENASYPAFTYQDLAFPGLVSDDAPLNQLTRSRMVYNITIPAVRPDFRSCRLYDSSQIETSPASSLDTSERSYKVIVQAEKGCFSDELEQLYFWTKGHANEYFGVKYGSSGVGCSTHYWIWGRWTNASSNNTKDHLQSIHVLACNVTLQIVDTSVEIDAQTMTVNTHNPPIADYANALSLTSPNTLPMLDFYNNLPQLATLQSDANLDSFFTIITSSRYSMPISYLGDASRAPEVVDSIQFHHRIIVVQVLDQLWRYDNQTSAGHYLPVWDKPTIFNATARDPYGHNRLVQDVVSTRVLQSLLSTALICLGVNWYLMRNVDIVPRSPTTIANWMALLADGNLENFLPQNTAQMPLRQISRWYFGQDAVFYLGHRKSHVSGKESLGIYVVSQHSGLDKPTERGHLW